VFNGKKLDMRTESQMMLAEMFGGDEDARRDAEAILRGPSRTLLGLNISERIGFTSLIPEFEDGWGIVPALSSSVLKIQEYLDRRNSGVQPIGAYVAAVSPFIGKGPSDLLKGFVQYPMEGVRTRYGTLVKPSEEMTFFEEQLPRGTGFQSADIAREMQARQAAKNISESTRDAERRNTLRLGKLLADAVKADKAGKKAEAEKIRMQFDREIQKISKEYAAEIQAGNMEDAIKPPSDQTLKNAIMAELYPGMKLERVGKLKRPAVEDIYRTIKVEDEEDESEDGEYEAEGGIEPALPQ
jgi:hypothetical protein